MNFDKSESQIWRNPSDALDSLVIFSPEKLEMTEKMHWYLLSELANSRLNRSGSPDSVMMMVIDYYNQRGLQSYAARAYYVQGLEYMIQSCGSNVASSYISRFLVSTYFRIRQSYIKQKIKNFSFIFL